MANLGGSLALPHQSPSALGTLCPQLAPLPYFSRSALSQLTIALGHRMARSEGD